jgi:hypothetical protein
MSYHPDSSVNKPSYYVDPNMSFGDNNEPDQGESRTQFNLAQSLKNQEKIQPEKKQKLNQLINILKMKEVKR